MMPYLASIGVASANDLCTPGIGQRLTQLAFEAALGVNDPSLLVDFVIGPEREWIGNYALCGGSFTNIQTLSDLISFYIPSSLLDYFNTVKATRARPSYASLSLGATSGSAYDAASDTLTSAYLVQVGPERCLPQGDRTSALLDYNFARYLRDMLHDGPGYAGFRSTPPPTFTHTGPDWNAISQEIVAGVVFVVGTIASAYSAGALSPVLALAATLYRTAMSMSQTIASMASGVGYNNGAWMSYSGLSALLNSEQRNLTKLDTQTLSLVNEVEGAPGVVGAAASSLLGLGSGTDTVYEPGSMSEYGTPTT